MQFIYELRIELDRVERVGDLPDELKDEADHLLVPKADDVLDVVEFQGITWLYQDHPYSLADELPDPSKLNNLVETVKFQMLWSCLKCFLYFDFVLCLEFAVCTLLVHLGVTAFNQHLINWFDWSFWLLGLLLCFL